jgi:hypothetical protein
MSKNRDDRGRRFTTNTVGLLVVLEAKAGMEDDLASFLTVALPLVQQEPETTAWFAARHEVPGAAFDSTEFLDVDVDQFARPGALAARHKLKAEPD